MRTIVRKLHPDGRNAAYQLSVRDWHDCAVEVIGVEICLREECSGVREERGIEAAQGPVSQYNTLEGQERLTLT